MLIPTLLKDLRPGHEACRTPDGPVFTVLEVHQLSYLDMFNITVGWPDGRKHTWGEDRLTRPGGPPKTFLRVTPAPGGEAA